MFLHMCYIFKFLFLIDAFFSVESGAVFLWQSILAFPGCLVKN